MKNKVNRSGFKTNFLKKVIIRIAYNGVLDLDINDTIKNV